MIHAVAAVTVVVAIVAFVRMRKVERSQRLLVGLDLSSAVGRIGSVVHCVTTAAAITAR